MMLLNFLDVVVGGVDDYVKGVCGVKYFYIVELRDIGLYGSVVFIFYIIFVGEEIFVGFKVFVIEFVYYEYL